MWRPSCDMSRPVVSSDTRFRHTENPNWALETGPKDLPIMTHIKLQKALAKGEKDENYKDLLLNYLLKVNRRAGSCQSMPKPPPSGLERVTGQLPTCNLMLF